MYCRPKVLPPIIHPTINRENHLIHHYVVPHIHPSHTTTFNHHVFQHQRYFPYTEPTVNDALHQDLVGFGPEPRPLFGP
ncbi:MULTISPECIES: CotD family spore coat protein [Bacillus]|jgi:spore coat protein D|uniref:CotD family spore coat protein n=1 Tax=Bacillus TaxID=1386 RepID=UPI00065E4583|nr:CotD family spore coat protein [Bacillus smithii]AKP47530.1 Inner spore coat protein D [Bacillus smithii]MED4882594.1 CotD family spore coat protein [Bacillus smithii]MED4927733.1 CotD family spore coat protein [Bacillus smithii]